MLAPYPSAVDGWDQPQLEKNFEYLNAIVNKVRARRRQGRRQRPLLDAPEGVTEPPSAPLCTSLSLSLSYHLCTTLAIRPHVCMSVHGATSGTACSPCPLRCSSASSLQSLWLSVCARPIIEWPMLCTLAPLELRLASRRLIVTDSCGPLAAAAAADDDDAAADGALVDGDDFDDAATDADDDAADGALDDADDEEDEDGSYAAASPAAVWAADGCCCCCCVGCG